MVKSDWVFDEMIKSLISPRHDYHVLVINVYRDTPEICQNQENILECLAKYTIQSVE